MGTILSVGILVLLLPYQPADQTKTASGLIYETVVKGAGAIAKRGDKLRIHETLSLPDGRVIFNSREKNQTVTFELGANQVIPGVDEGVTGMRVGERRKLLVPPSLDGRKFDPSFIPPEAIRHYDIELVEIVAAQPAARPQRTEDEARARAAANRKEREEQRVKSGAPVELIPDYVKANIGPVPHTLGVDPFYKKYVDAFGIPVIASDEVPDAALLVARDIVNSMLAARPDLRKAMIARKWRTGVIAEVEMTMDIPEYARMKRPGAPARRAGRAGGPRLPRQPIPRPRRQSDDRRGGEPARVSGNALLGRAHLRPRVRARDDGRGIRDVDPAMHAEIRAAYDAAMAAGKYVHPDGRKHYATTNAGEYWAEGVQWWFFSNYGECFAGNVKVETPEEFAAYDPKLHRAARPRLHDAPDPDGRFSREADSSRDLRAVGLRRSGGVLFLRAAVGGERRDDVADPAEQAARPDPQARCDDQPEDPAQEITVVELPDTGNQRAEDGRETRVLDVSHSPPSLLREREKVFVRKQLHLVHLAEPGVFHPAGQLLAGDLEVRLSAMRAHAPFVVDDDDAACRCEVGDKGLEIGGAVLDVMQHVMEERHVDRLDG